MRLTFAAVPLFLLSASLSHTPAASAQAAAAAAVTAAPHIASALPAVLSGAVSSGSAHAGQAVLARLASPSVLSNGAKLPAGTQLLGHITQVQSLAQGSGKSSLGMVFDHFQVPGSQPQELSPGTLGSIGSGKRSQKTARQQSTQQTQSSSSGNAVGGLLGGVTDTVGSTVNSVGNTATSLVGTVTGLPGVLLTSTGTLVAQGHDVDVPAGTQVSVTASAQASAQ